MQKEVDALISLMHEAGMQSEPDLSMLAPEQKREHLLTIIFLMMQDGELEEQYFKQVEEWLQRNKEVLDYYVEFQFLSAALHVYFHKDRQARLVERVKAMIAESRAVNHQ